MIGAFKSTKEELSSGKDLFVEDAALGAHSKYRIGVRIITQDVKIAMIMRTLLVRFNIETSSGIVFCPLHRAKYCQKKRSIKYILESMVLI